ncbi:hypothetical protein ACH47B_13290 [Rhodococcus sp. NPDC019627]|uniref:hypothetical protein n=1 Tax=unclassified Rhodococcus (in: high G+C Gram-positive bacteria) TaxID=192944 RepID=UPI0033CF8EA0
MSEFVPLSLAQIDELIRCTAYSYEVGDVPEDASAWAKQFMIGDGGLMNLQDLYREALLEIERLQKLTDWEIDVSWKVGSSHPQQMRIRS